MHRRQRIALPDLARAFVLAAAFTSLVGCSDAPRHGKHSETGTPPANPPELILSLGAQERLAVPEGTGGDTCQVFSDGRGRQWAFFARFQALEYMVKRDSGWEKMKDFTPSGWKFFDRMLAVADGQGDPIVVMAGYDGTAGEALAAIHWTGSEWGTPILLDRLEPTQSVNVLDAVTDPAGRVHVIYDRPLVPPELYSIGILIGDGAFPDKCFHVFFNGESWSRPTPTTGKGRFYVDCLTLSTSRDGRICLSCLVDPFSRFEPRPDYVACQFWQGNGWSKLKRATTPNPDYVQGFLVMDGWGQEHVWTREYQVWAFCYARPTSRTTADEDGPAGGTKPVVEQMPDGKLAVNAHGKVSVWNGRIWSEPVDVGDLLKLGVTPAGGLFAWDWIGGNLIIQEIAITKK